MLPLRYGSVLTNIILITVLPEVESRTQGSRPKPRTQKKKSEAKDRPSQGQGLRTQAQVFSKKSLKKIFSGDLKKKGL